MQFTGASSSRVSVPSLSPQNQQIRPHNLQQPGLPVTSFEANLVSFCILISIFFLYFHTFEKCQLTHSSKLI